MVRQYNRLLEIISRLGGEELRQEAQQLIEELRQEIEELRESNGL